MEFVEADGLKIAFERVGAGPPLVLVHGAAEDSRTWQRQLAVLADEFTVVAWDQPGAGRSCDLPEGMTLAGFADGLAALVESLCLGPAHVAGLSWGGTVAGRGRCGASSRCSGPVQDSLGFADPPAQRVDAMGAWHTV